jgi:hypothetical protein
MKRTTWSKVLLVLGLIGMLAGVLDPLEGSVIILGGAGLLALSALVGVSRYRVLLCLAFALVAFGVAAMFVLSNVGGFGGSSGRSNWWWLAILPYPAGWLTGLIGSFLMMRKPETDPE